MSKDVLDEVSGDEQQSEGYGSEATPESGHDAEEQAQGDESEDEIQHDEPLHLISSAVDRFVHNIRDIEECAQSCIPEASRKFINGFKNTQKKFETHKKIFVSEASPEEKLVAARELRKAYRSFKRLRNDATIQTLEKSLFIGMFTCFDKFVGELMEGVYAICPELYKKLGSQYTASEVLEYSSLADFKAAVLDKEIETVRRKSYIEQFKEFEKRFGFESLTKFDSWALFVEASQRRNLFTHCNGIVSNQYLKICTEAGSKLPKDCVIGAQLGVGAEYFYGMCRVVMEVGIMLGHTVWRKLLPDERLKADSELNHLIYDFLYAGQFRMAESVCKFAVKLPKISDDIRGRLFCINHAIAVRELSGVAAAKKILEKKDWSAVSYDFKLARAVLLDEFEEAKNLMVRIGKKGEIVTEEAYHDWPLFRKFRERQEFIDGYEIVYGTKYLSKLSELVQDAQDKAEGESVQNEE